MPQSLIYECSQVAFYSSSHTVKSGTCETGMTIELTLLTGPAWKARLTTDSVPTPAPGEGHAGLLLRMVSEVLPVPCVHVTRTPSKTKMMISPKCARHMVVLRSAAWRREGRRKWCWRSSNTRSKGPRLKFTISRQPKREIVEN